MLQNQNHHQLESDMATIFYPEDLQAIIMKLHWGLSYLHHAPDATTLLISAPQNVMEIGSAQAPSQTLPPFGYSIWTYPTYHLPGVKERPNFVERSFCYCLSRVLAPCLKSFCLLAVSLSLSAPPYFSGLQFFFLLFCYKYILLYCTPLCLFSILTYMKQRAWNRPKGEEAHCQ